MPSFLTRFNLSTTGNIGSTIGGITAPILGILSSIFLFITLIKQIESAEKTRLKNESDIIFLLINQLNSEYENFYFKIIKANGSEKKEVRYYGFEALNEFASHYPTIQGIEKIKYSSTFGAKQISILINSFSLIHKRIDISQLDDTLKELFQDKIRSIYICKMHDSFKFIQDANNKLNKTDELIREMQEFINKFSKAYNLE